MWPAVGSEMFIPAAMSGSSPMATNSVVPIPKPPSASANTASRSTAGGGATTAGDTEERAEVRVNEFSFLRGGRRVTASSGSALAALQSAPMYLRVTGL